MGQIVLSEDVIPASEYLHGSTTPTLAAGQKLKIQTIGDEPSELMFHDGPANNKTWTATVTLQITES